MRKVILVLLATLLGFAWAQDSKVLRIGLVDSDAASVAKKFQPFVDYAGASLKSAGWDSAVVVVAKDTAEMGGMIRDKKVDVYIDTVYPVLMVSRIGKLDLSFRRWKKGVSEYKAVFVAKKSSPLTSLDKLAGLTIGFEDPTSTSAFLLPFLQLSEKGFSLAQVNSGEKAASGKVGYLFTGAAENTPLWILQGKVDVGVFSSNDWDEVAAGAKSNLKVLGESAPVPRQLIALRSSLGEAQKAALRTFLLGLDKGADGQAMLKSWEKTAKVDEVTPEMRKSILTIGDRMKTFGL